MTHIIIINWNGGEDTWLSLQSVLLLADVRITVFDNGSTDNSISFIREQLGSRQISFNESPETAPGKPLDANGAKITIRYSLINLGFAKAINQVIETLSPADTQYVWLLNNDAIAEADTLSAMIRMLESRAGLGFTGSLILDANKEGLIQCAGVRYFKWLGVAKMRLKNTPLADFKPNNAHTPRADFQHGASLLIRMDVIRQMGLMDERFFLYSEEHDWQVRAAEQGFGNALCADSIVRHKGSMSTAANRHLFFYYYCKSSVLFSRKHHAGLVACTASVALLCITMIRTRLNTKSMKWTIKGMQEAWRTKL